MARRDRRVSHTTTSRARHDLRLVRRFVLVCMAVWLTAGVIALPGLSATPPLRVAIHEYDLASLSAVLSTDPSAADRGLNHAIDRFGERPGVGFSERLAAKSVRPAVSDTRLGRALADDYRGGPNPIGDGSALDAARHTVTTGDLVGGSTHLEKVVEMRDRYARILRRGGLSPADEAVARSRYGAYRGFAQEHDLDAMMKARGLR